MCCLFALGFLPLVKYLFSIGCPSSLTLQMETNGRSESAHSVLHTENCTKKTAHCTAVRIRYIWYTLFFKSKHRATLFLIFYIGLRVFFFIIPGFVLFFGNTYSSLVSHTLNRWVWFSYMTRNVTTKTLLKRLARGLILRRLSYFLILCVTWRPPQCVLPKLRKHNS